MGDRRYRSSRHTQEGGIQSNPPIDPTANVVALSAAANKRQDDLRDLNDRRIDAEIKCLDAELGCLKDISQLRADHVAAVMALRAEYSNKLSEAEAKRIDAIRAVDVTAVAVANERQAASASVLASQVAQSADALRTLVATTATAIAEQQRQQFAQFTDRLTVVERSQYEGRGKQLIADPMQAELLAEVKALRESRAGLSGKSEGGQSMLAAIIAVIGVVLAVAAYFAGAK